MGKPRLVNALMKIRLENYENFAIDAVLSAVSAFMTRISEAGTIGYPLSVPPQVPSFLVDDLEIWKAAARVKRNRNVSGEYDSRLFTRYIRERCCRTVIGSVYDRTLGQVII